MTCTESRAVQNRCATACRGEVAITVHYGNQRLTLWLKIKRVTVPTEIGFRFAHVVCSKHAIIFRVPYATGSVLQGLHGDEWF